MKLGFIGTGAITSAMVTGLRTAPAAACEIRVSPRNPDVAGNLAARFEGVSVGSSNQDVLDWCDTAVIAVRPQIAPAVLAELSFRPDHHVLSLVSGLSVGRLAALAAPAARITRAVPLTSAARRQSPTGVFPADREALELFAGLGSAFAAESEGEFEVICAATAVLASYFGFAGEIASWLALHGIAPEQARGYLGMMFSGLSGAAMESPQLTFEELARDHATRGGINEQVLAHLTSRGMFTAVSEGLDAVLRRITQRS